jgi:hypothetical protein
MLDVHVRARFKFERINRSKQFIEHSRILLPAFAGHH